MKDFLDKLSSPKMRGALRHFLTSAGGVLVAKGYADSAMVEVSAGAIMAIVGFYWSWTAGEKQ